jgi:radical SAM superfamily enzyme YgiQ (UPF0313 family)
LGQRPETRSLGEAMRVLLVSPTALDSRGQPIRQHRVHLPGLTLPMLAAVSPPGVELRLVIETSEPVPMDDHWDLVGLTGMGSGIVRAWALADEFRRRGVPVVLGGIAATLGEPEWSLRHADAVVLGEAEEVWPVVLSDFAAGRLQRTYRAERLPPIDQLPVPRYDLMNRRTIGLWRPVQATRGCPFSCQFCSVTSFFGGRYRKRPVDQVVRDVREAKRWGTRYIAFVDDNIAVDMDYAAALWEALIPERIIWMSQCSLHIADHPKLLRLASRSGCRMLSFGIESTSAASLRTIDKAWNRPERYPEAIATIRRHGIDVSTEMIIGLDGDDETVFDRTFDFIMSNAISIPRVHILTPVPGTPLYDNLRGAGRLLSDDFSRFSGGQVVYAPKALDASQLQAGYWSLYQRLFSWPNLLRRIGRNRASLGGYMRAVVVAVNLHYRNHIARGICPGIV